MTQLTHLQACQAVANDWRELAHKIRNGNDYGDHVTDAQKDVNLRSMLADASELDRGDISCFALAQRVNEKMTGECVALLA